MVIVIIDAGVALKWFVDEDGSKPAEILLTRADVLIAPDLIRPEVCNATWKMVRRGMMHPAQQIAAVTRVPSILDELVPTAAFAPRAAALSRALDHPVYDCFYMALREQRDGTLVSADRRLVHRVTDTIWERMV